MLDQKQVGVVNILRKTQGTKLTVSTYNLKNDAIVYSLRFSL